MTFHMSVNRRFLKDISAWDFSRPLSILGATGSGKSSTIVNFLRQNPELIKTTLLVSVDAVAVFEGLNIGSAKALGSERSQFHWAGLDIFPPTFKVNLADFIKSVEASIFEAKTKGWNIVFVGGSHFYERALVAGQSVGQESNIEFQKSLEAFSPAQLFERLCKIDQRFANKIHTNDRYRLSRYLDLAEFQTLSYDQIFAPPKRYGRLDVLGDNVDCLLMGLNLSQELVELRLKTRILEMFEMGWIDEVKTLLKSYAPDCPGLQSVGYREVVSHLNGNLSFEDCVEHILIAHRQLAKKQRTWLRGMLA